VFNQYYSKVYFFLLKKTRSSESAGELAQLTFIKLWQFRDTLTPDLDFDLQLFNIACSTLIDFLRRENTRRKKHLLLAENALQEQEAHSAGGFEEEDYLHTLTRTLPPVRKKVFILSRIKGHSYKEIAEQLSISSKTVEDHMVKALRHLRSIASNPFLFLLLPALLLY